MPSKLLLEVADYCWSKNFLDVFRQFFTDHGSAFEGAPLALVGGEHNLEYYNLFQVYLKLYETTLVTYLRTLDVTIEEFYKDVRDAQNETEDPYLSTFIDCLLASADYDSFYKVMAKEGAKSLAKKKMLGSSTKAESKSSAGESKMADRADMKRGSCAEGRDEEENDADYKSSRK